MTPNATGKQNRTASFRSLMSVLKPIREWLKNTPPEYNSPAPEESDDSAYSGDTQGHFTRTATARMSLPIMQHNKLRRPVYTQLQRRGPHQQPRSLGHIYLQHKGETKQATLPNELTALDTIRALFVCAFPHMLSMDYMSQPHVKIYIYNPSCNIFYELADIEDVKHESVLRIHQSDPFHSMTLPLPSPPPPPPVQQQVAAYHKALPLHSQLNGSTGSQIFQQQQQQIHHQFNNNHHQQVTFNNQSQLQQHQQAHSMRLTPQPIYQQVQPMIQQHHQLLTNPQLPVLPPPKPRRMIPQSYSLARLNPPPPQ